MIIRKLLLIFWLLIVFSGIALLFWYNEWRYSLPTPVPKDYKEVMRGEIININYRVSPSEKPIFLHFFNPDCPCSRFNITQFKSLVNKYGDKFKFIVVAITEDEDYTAEDIRNKFGLELPVLFDKSIADACGVYSTPQAAIINTDRKLYYRGNYNKSRYCTDKKSNYAEMAADSLLSYRPEPVFSYLAIKSYGCELPGCKK